MPPGIATCSPLAAPPISGTLCADGRHALGFCILTSENWGSGPWGLPGVFHGEVAERLKAAVLKTARVKALVGSNPTLSAKAPGFLGVLLPGPARGIPTPAPGIRRSSRLYPHGAVRIGVGNPPAKSLCSCPAERWPSG